MDRATKIVWNKATEGWHKETLSNQRKYIAYLIKERDRIQSSIDRLEVDIQEHDDYIEERFKHGPADNSDGTPASTSDGRG